jgi:hypothetical protein
MASEVSMPSEVSKELVMAEILVCRYLEVFVALEECVCLRR